MKWSICILTQPSRELYLSGLLALFSPERPADVELKVKFFDRSRSLGANRQQMIEESTGTYVNFIDDDDKVARDYVETIYPLLDGVDYIGFQVQTYFDGVPQKLTYHTLRCGGWSEDERGYYRDLSHINPIRRELALLVPFEGGVGEDHRWADRLRETNAVLTENYIDRVMYHYYFRTKKQD